MDFLKICVNIFGSGVETIAFYIFFNTVGGKIKVSQKVSFLVYATYFICSSIVVLIFKNPFIFLIAMFTQGLAVLFIYKSNFFIKVFESIIITILSVLSEILTGIIFAALTKMSVEKVSSITIYYIQCILVSKAMLLVFVKIIQYKKLPSRLKITKSLFIPMLALPASTIFIIYIMAGYAYTTANFRSTTLIAVASMMLISINILIFHLFEKQLRQDEESQKNTLIQQQLQYQTQYFKEMAEKYKLSNKTVHDTKNQLFAISIAIENNDMEKAKHKIDELCSHVSGGANAIRTGNNALDALLNTKYNDIRNQGIDFNHDIVISPQNQIDDIDLCIIIGNALDNAIEACSKLNGESKKVITLKMVQVNDHLAIEMTNPTPGSVQKAGGKFISSKKEKELHGFGLQSIEETVNKYNGNLSCDQKDNMFILKIYVENFIQIVENFA